MKTHFLLLAGISLAVAGCATNDPHLGYHMALVKQQQTYNPNASHENLAVVPEGNGERMEDVYNIYTGKKAETLQGTTSRVITGFD